MKFKRYARDRNNHMLDKGDIVQVTSDIVGVVTGIIRRGRENFPEVQITAIETNMLGKVTRQGKSVYEVADYKKWFCLNPNTLRDDVDKFKRAKSISSRVIATG